MLFLGRHGNGKHRLLRFAVSHKRISMGGNIESENNCQVLYECHKYDMQSRL